MGAAIFHRRRTYKPPQMKKKPPWACLCTVSGVNLPSGHGFGRACRACPAWLTVCFIENVIAPAFEYRASPLLPAQRSLACMVGADNKTLSRLTEQRTDTKHGSPDYSIRRLDCRTKNSWRIVHRSGACITPPPANHRYLQTKSKAHSGWD